MIEVRFGEYGQIYFEIDLIGGDGLSYNLKLCPMENIGYLILKVII